MKARAIALLLLALSAPLAAQPAPHAVQARVFFSPRQGCLDAILNEISKAQREIRVEAYDFTSVPIAQALIAARWLRGINVQVIVDDNNTADPFSMAAYLLLSGITLAIDKHSGIAHNKVMLIDDQTVLTGSYNWTDAAETRNAENLLILTGASLAQACRQDWDRHLLHLQTYTWNGKGSPKIP